ncbi:F-box/kelch-repeat protein At1g57790 [Linum perenne]
MAGRKRRKVKSFAATVTNDRTLSSNNKSDGNLELHNTWSDLPTELLEEVLCRLSFQDNILASAVCKRWQICALSVRVVNKPPWLMYFPKFGNLYEFYDPARRRTYFIELPELCGSRVCYTRDGWLLLYRPNNHGFFFFNPYSQEVMELPRFELSFQIVAFSGPPTSTSCVVFTVKHIHPTVVSISTCRPGATEWVTVSYQNRLPFVSSIWNKIVFCNRHFYCLSLTGWLGVFNPFELTWDVLAVPPPKCPENFFAKNWWKGKFMTEHDGEILVIYTCCSQNPVIFRLDDTNMIWEEMNTLNGLTLFGSFLSSHSRTDLVGIMRNSIYFSKVRFFGKRCISYSLDNRRYYPRKQCYDWSEQDPFGNIWIDPPDDLSSFL